MKKSNLKRTDYMGICICIGFAVGCFLGINFVNYIVSFMIIGTIIGIISGSILYEIKKG